MLLQIIVLMLSNYRRREEPYEELNSGKSTLEGIAIWKDAREAAFKMPGKLNQHSELLSSESVKLPVVLV